MKYEEIESIQEFLKVVENQQVLKKYAFQDIDFEKTDFNFSKVNFSDCIFLGCNIPLKIKDLISEDCIIIPQIDVPFNPFVAKLYTKETLMDKYIYGQPDSYKNTYDNIVYQHYLKTGKEADDIKETLARRLHDHSITDALYDFLADYNERKVVAIMGGHSLSRADNSFFEVAKISKKLTEKGYLMVSGGGPGAMEATHVGAWFAGKSYDELKLAVETLALAPTYKHKLWLDKAFEVLEKYPTSEFRSLGIPTWLYGHEPPTPFATHIAKYFANSVREDGLLTIAKGGVVFTPGSAGTVQEVFQDVTQNHYLSFGYSSPMVFLNSDFWNNEVPVFSFLKFMIDAGNFENLILSIYDNAEDVIKEIEKFTK